MLAGSQVVTDSGRQQVVVAGGGSVRLWQVETVDSGRYWQAEVGAR